MWRSPVFLLLLLTAGIAGAADTAPQFPVQVQNPAGTVIDTRDRNWTLSTATDSLQCTTTSSALPAGAATEATLSAFNTKFVASTVDGTNSTTTVALGANAAITGTFIDILNYPCFAVAVLSDQASAANGLQIDWSANGSTLMDSDQFTIPAASGQQFSFGRKWRYYRIRYTNGAVAATGVTISSILSQTCQIPSTHRAGDTITTEDDAQLVVAVPARLPMVANAPAAPTVGVASAQILAANTSRKGLVIVNVSNNTVSFGLGATAVLNAGITLYPGGTWYMDQYAFTTGAINAIASAASSPISVQELQ